MNALSKCPQYRCPKCGSDGHISIETIREDGSLRIENGSLYVMAGDAAHCHACGYKGEAKEFLPIDGC